jgi:aldose 1-epimerase
MKRTFLIVAAIIVVAVLLLFAFNKFSCKGSECSDKCAENNSQVQLFDAAAFEKTIDGKQVSLYTLKNENGMTTQITNFGGRVVNLWVKDKNNEFRDVVTGFKSIDEYLSANEVFFGALIGRYGNRIAKGKFTLNGKEYQLAVNNGENHLHGGPKGFHNVVWDARQFKNEAEEDALELTYLSVDGEEGYPGNLNVKVVYTLTKENELKIEYTATTDKPTVANITHHSFFNLHGFSGGKAEIVNTHMLQINASKYNPTDGGLIPTGVLANVEGTPMDFRKFTAIGERVEADFADLKNGKGYDHNWILDKNGEKVTEAAVIYEPASGIQMRVITDQPAMQFYGGNFFEGKDTGKYGEVYNFRTSFAMETQHFPDSPNQKNFPTTTLNPGETYTHLCIYKFETKYLQKKQQTNTAIETISTAVYFFIKAQCLFHTEFIHAPFVVLLTRAKHRAWEVRYIRRIRKSLCLETNRVLFFVGFTIFSHLFIYPVGCINLHAGLCCENFHFTTTRWSINISCKHTIALLLFAETPVIVNSTSGHIHFGIYTFVDNHRFAEIKCGSVNRTNFARRSERIIENSHKISIDLQ